MRCEGSLRCGLCGNLCHGLRDTRHGRLRLCRHLLGLFLRYPPEPQPGGVEATEAPVERGQISLLGMIGEQNTTVVMISENILHEAVQCRFGPDLDEDPGTGFVETVQPGDELYGGRDLATQNVHDLLGNIGAHRIEVPADVGDDRQNGRLNVEATEHLPQRVDGRSDNLGMEGVAHRQLRGPEPGIQASLDRRVDGGGRTADHRLAGAVDVGHNNVTVDRVDDPLDLL